MINKILNKFNGFKKESDVSVGYDILIHIGGPKSGSSAIQKFLTENHENLKDFGYYYPVHKLDKNGVSGGHWEIGKAIIENNLSMAKEIIFDYLESAKNNNCTLILSAESFWGASNSLPSLVEDFKVRYIAFFRHPIDAMASNYNQLVKRHLGKLTFNEYISINIDSPNKGITGEILCDWLDSVGDALTVYPYSVKEFGADGIVKVFLNYIGINSRSLKISNSIVNRSYPASILEFKRLLNFALSEDDKAEDIKIDVELQNMSDDFESEKSFSLDDAALFSLGEFRALVDPVVANIEGKFNISMLSDLDGVIVQRVGGIPLESVFEKFRDSDSFEFIRNRVSDKLKSGLKSYELLKLADHLGISFSIKDIPDRLFNRELYKNTVSSESQLADVLRNLALLYEKNDKKEEALELISLARDNRPTGPFINAMYDRLSKEIDG